MALIRKIRVFIVRMRVFMVIIFEINFVGTRTMRRLAGIKKRKVFDRESSNGAALIFLELLLKRVRLEHPEGLMVHTKD
jgi:hypothetical protein